jgi:High potential iron-sulfur protein
MALIAGQLAMTGLRGISRRHVLTIAAGAAGSSIACATAVIGTSTPAQAAKVSQKIVKYQDTPKGEQRCDNCELFEAPSSCKNVDGTIAAQGWCIVYRKKQA